jgi:hypothetical protein
MIEDILRVLMCHWAALDRALTDYALSCLACFPPPPLSYTMLPFVWVVVIGLIYVVTTPKEWAEAAVEERPDGFAAQGRY